MQIACSTSVGCNSTLEETLQALHQYGFEKIDLLVIDNWVHVNTQDLVNNWDETVTRVEQLLKQYQVKPTVINSGISSQLHDRTKESNEKRQKEIKALVKFMKHLDIKIAAIQPRNQDSSRPWQEVIDDCVTTLVEQIEMGKAEGVTFALELHVGSPFETMEHANYLLDKLPDLPLIYDPTHFVMQGIDIRETARLMDHAIHVHLRDAAKGKLQTKLGEGDVDFVWLLDELNKRGYQGNVSIEYLQTDEFDVLPEAVKLRDLILQHR